jgi:hypothetical protein
MEFEIKNGTISTTDPEAQSLAKTFNSWFNSKELDGKTIEGQSFYSPNQRMWYFIQSIADTYDWEVLEDTEFRASGATGDAALN